MFNYFFSEYKRRYRIKWSKKSFIDFIKKKNCETTREYKLRAIDNLVELCKDPVFDLYTSEGIDWLLKMCDNEIKENIEENQLTKSAFSALWSTISSVGGFIVGAVADNINVDGESNLSALVNWLVFLCIIVLFVIIGFFSIFYMIIPGVRTVLNKKLQDLETLRDNLEYIKVYRAPDLQKSASKDTSMSNYRNL